MSCESSRTRAYDPNLRWRMIYQRFVMELSARAISQNLCADVSTVHRTIDLFLKTQSVDKQPYSESHRLQRRKLKEADQYLIPELVLEYPGIYLDEQTI